MKKYPSQHLNSFESCKSSGYNIKVHFKNTRETASFVRGMNINRAKQFLNNVCLLKEIVPFRRYKYGVGRKSQLKLKKFTNGRWPVKSAHFLLKILKNAEKNALMKNFDMRCLYIAKIQVNKAIRGNRRTFRAHGQINSYSSHPCHVEMWLTQKNNCVKK